MTVIDGYAEQRLAGLRQLIEQAERDGDEALAAGLATVLEEELVWRPEAHQVPPAWNWTIWALIAGRGAGKTDAGAAALNEHMLGPPCDLRVPGGHRARIIAPTFGDAIASCVLGPSGVKAHNPEIQVKGGAEGTILYWPNGARASVHGCHTPGDVDRLRAQTNACFAAGSLVLTLRGDVPIEQVHAGDLVWTREGWRHVRRAWCSGLADLWRLVTDDGREIVGTADHLVWADGTWTPLALVSIGARLSAWNRSDTKAATTGVEQTATTELAAGSSTATSTPPRSDRSPTAGTSTTATETRPTTGSRTSWRSPLWRTSPSIPATAHGTPRADALRAEHLSSGHARSAGRVSRPGTMLGSAQRSPAHPDAGGRSTVDVERASDGAMPFVASAEERSGARSQRSARPALSRVAIVEPLGYASLVYDLTVDDAHEFCVDGVIVHNCLDLFEEAAAMRNIEGDNGAWAQAQFGRRLGPHPRAIITTTPKNRELVRRWIHTAQGITIVRWLQHLGWCDPAWQPPRRHQIALSTATTADNPHLDPDVRDELYETYGGTRLGEQELLGRLLEDVGNVFSSAWFGYRTGYQPGPHTLRYWDLAATEPGGANPDPDWTAGARVTYTPRAGIPLILEDGTEIATGAWNIDDIVRIRASAGQVMQTIVETARRDGPHVRVGIEQDRAQSGKSQVATYRKVLAGIARCEGWLPTGAKLTRATSVAVPAQQGNVTLTRADWNRALLDELEAFDGGKNGGSHDDQVDALSGAFTVLAGRGNLARVDSAPASARVPTAGGTRPATGRLTGNTRLPRRY